MKKSTLTFFIVTLLIAFASINTHTAQAQQGSRLGTIDIPNIGVSAPIVPAPLADETWDVSHLNMTVGHLQYMPFFDTPTNVALGGHSTDLAGNPDIFYALDQLRIGDDITVTVGETTYTYRVTHTFTVTEDDLSILYPTGTSRLTLFTCHLGSVRDGTYRYRTVVYAEPI